MCKNIQRINKERFVPYCVQYGYDWTHMEKITESKLTNLIHAADPDPMAFERQGLWLNRCSKIDYDVVTCPYEEIFDSVVSFTYNVIWS